ncbi:MAG: hypothetical protein K6B14_05225 [Lachnospiraceae bacterium]|nr:hypothetical protein [Lachnospiraceae bacterium]
MTKVEFEAMFNKLENLGKKEDYSDCKFLFTQMRDDEDDDELIVVYDSSYFENSYDDETDIYESVLTYLDRARRGDNMYIQAEYITSRMHKKYKLNTPEEFDALEKALKAQHEYYLNTTEH